jgi:hypothetical protein
MAQGYGATHNLLLQDNKSSMLLERNGEASSGKCTWYINNWYFFITDRINLKEVKIEWCPTKDMVADFINKPCQGSHFRRLRNLIMGVTSIKKTKNPSTSKATVIKRNNSVKVRLLERNKTARKQVRLSSVGLLTQ